MEQISNYLRSHRATTIAVIILFYIVGVAGIGFPFTRDLFVSLIPWVLLMSFIVIMFFHHSWNRNESLILFILIYFLSYFIEVLGVNTHLVFGNYSYGSGLGFKILGTPILIGINWVMVVYCSASILEWTRWPVVIQILSASVMLVLYDIVLEHVAPLLDMWSWKGDTIPFQNFLTWFILALIFHSFLKLKRVKTINPVASAIFICQLLFFIAILIFVK